MKWKPKKEDSQPAETDPVEERVRDMMELEPDPAEPEAAPTKQPESEVMSAPELPASSKKTIAVLHGESDDNPDKESLQTAIEEANEKLKEGSTISEKPEPEQSTEEEAPAKETEVEESVPPAAEEKVSDKDAVINSPETEKAVEEIVAKEGDDLLAAEDEKQAVISKSDSRTRSSGGKGFFGRILKSKVTHRLIVLLILAAIAAAAIIPGSRYYVLNAAGVRSSVSLSVIDQSTSLPLRNVEVNIDGQSGRTDGEGNVALSQLRLGPARLAIERRAFAKVEQNIIIGWGSNPLGEFELHPSGAQYVFNVTDYVSERPIEKVEALYEGEVSAFSDKEGVIKLTMDDVEEDVVEVILSMPGYRKEAVKVDINKQNEQTVKMVPARKNIFISNRTGTYDIYKVDLDGKNETLVLKGTGSEREDMVLAPHPTKELFAFVSTRGNKRNEKGALLSTLSFIDINTNKSTEVTESENIQLVGWHDNYLTYLQIDSKAAADSPERHRLISYNIGNKHSKELASANYFNDLMSIGGKIYYAPSSAHSEGINISLFEVDADGSHKKVVLDKEVWSLLRPEHGRLIFALQQEWYEYRLGDSSEPVKLTGEPENIKSRIYSDSPDGKHSLWVDRRDGKGVIVVYDTASKEDKVLISRSGLKSPARWIDDNTLIFRVSNGDESADYVISLDGGEPKKIGDVTDTSGVDRWYYY
ncbi:hypothetical protein BH23PAT1_BH23PAT1_4540 [soil metagenome]